MNVELAIVIGLLLVGCILGFSVLKQALQQVYLWPEKKLKNLNSRRKTNIKDIEYNKKKFRTLLELINFIEKEEQERILKIIKTYPLDCDVCALELIRAIKKSKNMEGK